MKTSKCSSGYKWRGTVVLREASVLWVSLSPSYQRKVFPKAFKNSPPHLWDSGDGLALAGSHHWGQFGCLTPHPCHVLTVLSLCKGWRATFTTNPQGTCPSPHWPCLVVEVTVVSSNDSLLTVIREFCADAQSKKVSLWVSFSISAPWPSIQEKGTEIPCSVRLPSTQGELRGGVRMPGIMGNIFGETKELLSHFLVLFWPTLMFHAHR